MPHNSKEKRKEYDRQYREKNKERIAEKQKEYREKNKEQRAEYRKEYREKNKEQILEKNKEYYEKNKEQRAKYRKEYVKTEQGKKVKRISSWKSKGIVSDDFDSLYDYYINCNNCEHCNTELIEGSGLVNQRHLDHDHETGLFRQVLCGHCNIHVFRK